MWRKTARFRWLNPHSTRDAAETVANGIIDAFAGTETAVEYARRTAQKVGDVLERELTKQNAALQEMQKQADAQHSPILMKTRF